MSNIALEEWKQVIINGVQTQYFISSEGRIKRKYKYKERILKPFKNQAGYSRVDIFYVD